MRSFKKLLSLFLAGVIAVTSMVCCAVTASAYDDFGDNDDLYAYYKETKDTVYIYLAGMTESKMKNIYGKDYETLTMTFSYKSAPLYLKYVGKPQLITSSFKGNDIAYFIKDGYYKKNASSYTFVFEIQNKYGVVKTLKNSSSVNVQLYAGKLKKEVYYNNTKSIKVNFYQSEKDIKSITAYTLSSIPNQTYTGSAIKPKVKLTKGIAALVQGTDYTVTYKNNTKIGIATVTLKGKGKYTGEMTKSFKILPAKTTLSAKRSGAKYKLSWTAVKGIDKYQVYVSADGGKTFSKTTIGGSETSGSLSLDTDNTYVFKIRSYKKVGKETYYSEFSNSVTV